MLNSNCLIILGMCLVTLVIMLLIMPGLIDYLHKIKFGQTEREEGLASHKKKNGTPTMGGLAFIIVPTLVYRFFLYSIQTGYEYNDYSTCLCRVWCCWIY